MIDTANRLAAIARQLDRADKRRRERLLAFEEYLALEMADRRWICARIIKALRAIDGTSTDFAGFTAIAENIRQTGKP